MADVISERGKKKLVYNHYIFWRDGQSSDGKITFWRCSNRYKSFCKARLHTVYGLITKELYKHSHLQEERHVQIAKVLLFNVTNNTENRKQIRVVHAYYLQQFKI